MSVHQLGVTLHDVWPLRVWRRVHVLSSAPLTEVHRVIQAVMGWEDQQPHAFETIWRQPYGDHVDAETVALTAVLPAVGDRLRYTYGVDDPWEHLFTVENIYRPAPRTRYPRCSGGQGAGPVEDSGGPAAYTALCQALRTPHHPRHQQARDRLRRTSKVSQSSASTCPRGSAARCRARTPRG